MSSTSLFSTTITPEEWKAIRGDDRKRKSTSSLLDACIAAGMPKRYTSVEPDTYRASAIASSNRGLYICGDVGAGKTHTACRILMGWVAGQHGTVRMVSSPAMLTEIRATYDEGGSVGGSEQKILRDLTGAGLLIVDDLGKEVPTVWALSKIFEIFDARWRAGLPIVVTTQTEPAGLAKHLSTRGDVATGRTIASRIMGTCRVVHVKGQDRRLAKFRR